MSWWISLNVNEIPVQVKSFTDGGTYALGGSTEADLNVTYNYGTFYRQAIDKDEGIRWLHEKIASETIDVLEQSIDMLGTKRAPDYWEETPGNAGYALTILLAWAKQYPNAVWRVN